MIQLRKVQQSELPVLFDVSHHAIERANERLSKRRLKTIGNVEAYLEEVARSGQVYTPGVFRKNERDPVPVYNYTKTDGQVVVAIVVPLNEDHTLSGKGFITTVMPKVETDERWWV